MKTTGQPAPRERVYQGERIDGTAVVRILEDGQRKKLNPRFDLFRHSPTGFEWGYEGSGPSQLALALVCNATGDDQLSLRVYQEFKREIVAGMGEKWSLHAGCVADFAKSLDARKRERQDA